MLKIKHHYVCKAPNKCAYDDDCAETAYHLVVVHTQRGKGLLHSDQLYICDSHYAELLKEQTE